MNSWHLGKLSSTENKKIICQAQHPIIRNEVSEGKKFPNILIIISSEVMNYEPLDVLKLPTYIYLHQY